VDDIAALLAHGQIVFLVWVTFGEHKWVILAERRSPESAPPNARHKLLAAA
jgi:hypothetical protein